MTGRGCLISSLFILGVPALIGVVVWLVPSFHAREEPPPPLPSVAIENVAPPQHHPVSDSELVPLDEARQSYTRAVAGEGIVFRNDNDNEPYAPAFASKLDLDEFKRALLAHNMPALEKITGYAVHVPAGSAVNIQQATGEGASRSVLVNITSGPLSGMNGLWMYSKYVVQ